MIRCRSDSYIRHQIDCYSNFRSSSFIMHIVIFFIYINNLAYIKKYAIIYIERGDNIRTINITNARQNLFQLVSDVNIGFNPITIVNNKEKELKKIANSFQRNCIYRYCVFIRIYIIVIWFYILCYNF